MHEGLSNELQTGPTLSPDIAKGAGRITVLEALAIETDMVSPDGRGRTTIDAVGNDMDD